MAGGSSKGPSFLGKAYLLLYNSAQTAGWSYLLYQLGSHYVNGNAGVKASLWDSTWWTVMIFQNSAVMEVIHAATGLVPSNAFFTFMQVYSRVFVVCGILAVTKAGAASGGLPLMLLAWSITEIVRYGYYSLSLIGIVPKFLTFLRYSLFLALYPLGITSELWCMYDAQNEIAKTRMWSTSMPNKYNFMFNYQYFIIIYMLLYLPFFPVLFGHMLKQRKKILGGGDTAKQTKKSK